MDEKSNNPSGNIELSGFRDVDGSSMDIIRKMIGNHANRLGELTKKLQKLHITLKPIHEREKSEKYEIHAMIIDDGKVYSSEVVNRNLIVAVDKVLNKLINELD